MLLEEILMKILGLHVSFNGFSHDSSASLIVNGKVVAAVEEEFNRIKSSQLFSTKLNKILFKKAACKIKDIDVLVVDGSLIKN